MIEQLSIVSSCILISPGWPVIFVQWFWRVRHIQFKRRESLTRIESVSIGVRDQVYVPVPVSGVVPEVSVQSDYYSSNVGFALVGQGFFR